MMRRREFITLIGGAATWPLAARAQQAAVPVIGYLDSRVAAAVSYQVEAFRRGLSEAGLVEGRNLAIEFRWAEGQLDRLPALAADLVRRRVAAIVTDTTSTHTAKVATSTIPIIFVGAVDPVEVGFVTSLNRPDGNVTGVSFTTGPLNPKRLELLHELVPKSAVIALLSDPNNPGSEGQLRGMEATARALGRQILILKAGTESEIDAAFATIVQTGAGALLVGGSAIYNGLRRQLAALAIRHGLPTSYAQREYVVAGGLMSYGASNADARRRGGLYVSRILKGEKPADLPVLQSTEFEFVINLQTARALGIELPPNLLAIADEVIE